MGITLRGVYDDDKETFRHLPWYLSGIQWGSQQLRALQGTKGKLLDLEVLGRRTLFDTHSMKSLRKQYAPTLLLALSPTKYGPSLSAYSATSDSAYEMVLLGKVVR